ncbi:MAG: VWA domain-containing protein, partial [Candidatus Acidiferrales bacterium]
MALSVLLALACVVLVAAQSPPPPGPPTDTLRVEVDVVNIYCTVKESNGRLVTDLTANDFEVREDGKTQELRYFVRETDRPLTLALLVDTSGSQTTVLPVEKEAVGQFLRQVLRPVDMVLLATFDVNVDLLQDFTQEVERIERALARARINAPVGLGPFPSSKGGTHLFDAVYLVAKEKLASEVGRKAIIVVSDGVDTGSEIAENSNKAEKLAIEVAQRSDTIIYAIGISDPGAYGLSGDIGWGRDVLKKLSQETGGRAYFPSKVEKLQEAFDQITTELRSQYSLGYTPTNRARDGGFRRVQVKVKRNGLRV